MNEVRGAGPAPGGHVTLPAFADGLRRSAAACRWIAPCDGGGDFETTNAGASFSLTRQPRAEGMNPGAITKRSGSLQVLVTCGLDLRRWVELAQDGPLLPAMLWRGRLVLGPVLSPQASTCPTCLFLRLAQSYPHSHVVRAAACGGTWVDDRHFGVLEALGSHVAEDLAGPLSDVAEEPEDSLGAAQGRWVYSVCPSAEGAEWGRHPIVACPGEPLTHQTRDWVRGLLDGARDPDVEWRCGSVAASRHAGIVDDLTGPIVKLSPVHAGLAEVAPQDLVGRVAVTGFLGEYLAWQPDVTGSGLAFEPGRAERAAVGEAFERYSANFVDRSDVVVAPLDDLDGAVVDPALAGANAAFPNQPPDLFRRFDSAAPEYWVRCEALGGSTRGLPSGAWVLAEQVHLNFTRFSGLHSLFPVPLAGVAAGRLNEDAMMAGLLELIERDSTMVWWYGDQAARRLVEVPREELGLISPADDDVELGLLLLPSISSRVAVVGAFLRDRGRSLIVTGFAARTSLTQAAVKAAAEAYQLHRLSALLRDPDSQLWTEIVSGRLPLPTVPSRADGRYRESFAADHSDMWQLALNLQYYLDPETHPEALRRLHAVAVERWEDASSRFEAMDLEELLDDCGSSGVDVYAKDLTTPDVAGWGHRVVRVVAPALVGNTPSAFPPYWHPRLAQVDGLATITTPLPHA